MAKLITWVSDLDDKKSTTDPADLRKVFVGLEGTVYQVDVTEAELEGVRKLLNKIITAAEANDSHEDPKVFTNAFKHADGWVEPAARDARHEAIRRRIKSDTGSGRSHSELNAIREWARAQGKTVADKGRIKASIIREYDQAHA